MSKSSASPVQTHAQSLASGHACEINLFLVAAPHFWPQLTRQGLCARLQLSKKCGRNGDVIAPAIVSISTSDALPQTRDNGVSSGMWTCLLHDRQEAAARLVLSVILSHEPMLNDSSPGQTADPRDRHSSMFSEASLVERTYPANSRISPTFRKDAAMTTVL